MAHGLFIDVHLLGYFDIGVLQRLATHPFDQAFGHLAGGAYLWHCGSEGLVAGLATQARHIQVDGHALAVRG